MQPTPPYPHRVDAEVAWADGKTGVAREVQDGGTELPATSFIDKGFSRKRSILSVTTMEDKVNAVWKTVQQMKKNLECSIW